MEAQETDASQQDKDVEVNHQTQDPPLETSQDNNSSEETDKNAAPDNEESLDKSATEGPDVTPEDTKPKDIPPLSDRDRGDCPEVKSPINLYFDNIDVKTPDGEPVPSTKESGDEPTVRTEETNDINVQEDKGKLESANENHMPLQQEAPAAEQTIPETDVETTPPTPPVELGVTSDVPGSATEHKRRNLEIWIIWIAVAVVAVAVVVALLLQLRQPREPPQKIDLCQIDIFHHEMEKMKVQFPSQRKELWKRSRIHLQRHFQIAKPTEPISIILTAGVRAESTLRCLAQNIASALSSALNASALYLDGVSKSSQDSDKVKSDIDSQLQNAFEGSKPIAVIHRFEELPPASTLIFYRYCDHENAAFKKTFLIFTVLLGEVEEIQTKVRLSEVEEMVTDHLQKKFLSHGHPTAFDKMDIDKYGGLWSRISHLILPVATEKRIEKTEQC